MIHRHSIPRFYWIIISHDDFDEPLQRMSFSTVTSIYNAQLEANSLLKHHYSRALSGEYHDSLSPAAVAAYYSGTLKEVVREASRWARSPRRHTKAYRHRCALLRLICRRTRGHRRPSLKNKFAKHLQMLPPAEPDFSFLYMTDSLTQAPRRIHIKSNTVLHVTPPRRMPLFSHARHWRLSHYGFTATTILA